MLLSRRLLECPCADVSLFIWQVYAFALTGNEAVQEVIRDYEKAFGPRQEEQFLLLQLLASTNVPPTSKRLHGDKPVASLSADAAALAQLLEAGHRTVLVCFGAAGAMPPRHAKSLTHSLSSSQFLLAQFYHAEIMAGYHAVFLSKDGKYAKTAAENQRKHHPKQRVRFSLGRVALCCALPYRVRFFFFCFSQLAAYSLGDPSVVAVLEHHEKGFSGEQNLHFSFALLLSATIVPPIRTLAPATEPLIGSKRRLSARKSIEGTSL